MRGRCCQCALALALTVCFACVCGGKCRLESGGLKQETVINPFEKKTVAKLTLRNPRGAWGLRCRYKWLEGAPDKAVLEAAVHKDMSTIGRLVEAAQSMDFGADSAGIKDLQDKCSVRARCLAVSWAVLTLHVHRKLTLTLWMLSSHQAGRRS